MVALKILFGSDIGLLSVFTIGFILIMAIFYVAYFMKKMNSKDENK